MADIHQRKIDHIELCDTGDVEHGVHRGLFEDVVLVHDALPELSMDELDLSTPFIDHQLAAPIMVTGMTGGPEIAGGINRGIAMACDTLGLAFGVGSQRIITRDAVTAATFDVRTVAPNAVVLGNIGVVQARELGSEAVRELVDRIGADYLAVHLNPAMELVQPGADADRDFRGGYDIIGRLVDSMDGRVVVKECGSGIAPWVAARLAKLGVRAIDVSGSGGTSWVKVEALRASGSNASIGAEFADWGIPTAAATAMARERLGADGPCLIASGGVDRGRTVATALALGADVAGMARPVLRAFRRGGEEEVRAFLETVISGLRIAMATTGCRRPAQLRQVPRIVGPRLGAWLEQARRFDR